jgi:hypothetical protein
MDSKICYIKRNSVFLILIIFFYGLWMYERIPKHTRTHAHLLCDCKVLYSIKRNKSFKKSMFFVWLLLFHKYEHNSILCSYCFFPYSALKKQEMCLWKRYKCVFFLLSKFLVVFVNAMMKENTNHNKNKRIRKLKISILM